MKARFHNSRLAVEALEGRSLMSTVAYGDFNKDGLVDMAAITNPTTVTVSLANPDGSYTVSAILTTPKNRPVSQVYAGDYNGDGKLDVNAVGAGDWQGAPQMNGESVGHWHFISPGLQAQCAQFTEVKL